MRGIHKFLSPPLWLEFFPATARAFHCQTLDLASFPRWRPITAAYLTENLDANTWAHFAYGLSLSSLLELGILHFGRGWLSGKVRREPNYSPLIPESPSKGKLCRIKHSNPSDRIDTACVWRNRLGLKFESA